jgi:hypothetical protein
MVDMVGMIEPALNQEIARLSAKRERWLMRSQNDIRLGVALNSRIGVMGIEIDEAQEAILADDPARAVRALFALRRYDDARGKPLLAGRPGIRPSRGARA